MLNSSESDTVYIVNDKEELCLPPFKKVVKLHPRIVPRHHKSQLDPQSQDTLFERPELERTPSPPTGLTYTDTTDNLPWQLNQILQAKQAQTRDQANSEIMLPLFSAANLQAAAPNTQNNLKLTPNQKNSTADMPAQGDSQINTPQHAPTLPLKGITPVNNDLSPSQQLLNSASPTQPPRVSPETSIQHVRHAY